MLKFYNLVHLLTTTLEIYDKATSGNRVSKKKEYGTLLHVIPMSLRVSSRNRKKVIDFRNSLPFCVFLPTFSSVSQSLPAGYMFKQFLFDPTDHHLIKNLPIFLDRHCPPHPQMCPASSSPSSWIQQFPLVPSIWFSSSFRLLSGRQVTIFLGILFIFISRNTGS
jgi:hypothetical protein